MLLRKKKSNLNCRLESVTRFVLRGSDGVVVSKFETSLWGMEREAGENVAPDNVARLRL